MRQADPLMAKLHAIAFNDAMPPNVQLEAIKHALKVTGAFEATKSIEVDVLGTGKPSVEDIVMSALVDVEETDDGDTFVTYPDGRTKIVGGWHEDIVDADVVTDDEPPVQTRSDRAFARELERSQPRAQRPGQMSDAERKQREAEALAAIERSAPPVGGRRVDRMTREEILLAREAGTNLSSRGDAMRDAVEADEAAGKRRTRNTEARFD